jgi:hypothetical protein
VAGAEGVAGGAGNGDEANMNKTLKTGLEVHTHTSATFDVPTFKALSTSTGVFVRSNIARLRDDVHRMCRMCRLCRMYV